MRASPGPEGHGMPGDRLDAAAHGNPGDPGDPGIGDEVRRRLSAVHWSVRQREVGRIVRVGDGVAAIRGLPSVRFQEVLEHPSGAAGLAFDLLRDEIGVLLLDPAGAIAAGDEMRATGRVAGVPVGRQLLGRVIDPLGRPLDGGASMVARDSRPIECEAPGVAQRLPVRDPLHTGVVAVDALLPIGRGQRELILGDRGTGKTALALDAILAQRETGVVCVYCAIGQRGSEVRETAMLLDSRGALEYTVLVVATADAPPGLQWLAPAAACAMGESFMLQGRHVLVVYDDLTRHADAYRRIGLLLERPPGREAYPADVFHLHARLLERSTRLRDDLGGGSLTALPIASMQAGNLAAYIPTNLISICDGQIVLDTRLFNAGLRPAIDVPLSVSRVGGKAQLAAMRDLAGELRLLYAQLRELETFVRFGGAELEAGARQRLGRGRVLREVFTQPRLAPIRPAHQVAILFAVHEGLFDPVPIERIGHVTLALLESLDVEAPDVRAAIERGEALTGETRDRLRAVIERVLRPFLPGGRRDD